MKKQDSAMYRYQLKIYIPVWLDYEGTGSAWGWQSVSLFTFQYGWIMKGEAAGELTLLAQFTFQYGWIMK